MAKENMTVLVLGGTQFVGRHIVEALLARGHQVSVLTRGRTADELPEGVERLRGEPPFEIVRGQVGRCGDGSEQVGDGGAVVERERVLPVRRAEADSDGHLILTVVGLRVTTD